MIKQSIKTVKSAKEVIIPANKSNILYKIPIPVYKKILMQSQKPAKYLDKKKSQK